MQRLIVEDLISKVNTVSGFSISPDGSKIAFTRQTIGDSQIYISSLSHFKPEKLTGGTGFKISPLWSPDGSRIAYLQDKDGNECFDIFTVNPENGSVGRVTSLPRSIFRGIVWSPDGKQLAFSSNYEGPHSIYTISADGQGLRRLTSATVLDILPHWSPDGNRLAYTRFELGRECSKIEVINREGGILLHSLCSEEESYTATGWSQDGVQISSNSDAPGAKTIGIFNENTGEIKWSAEEENELGRVWSEDGKYIAFLIDKDRNHQIAVSEVKSGVLEVAGPTNGLSSSPQFTPDGSGLLFIHEGPQNPSDIFYFNLVSGELHQLTNGLPDNVDPRKLVTPEEIRYPSFDGLEIPALLYKPSCNDTDVLPPAVLRLHGGPNYQSCNKWDPTIQLLLSHGYVVMAPNFRGSTGYGREFIELSKGDWGGGDLRDVIAAANFLETTEQADGNRIALYGGSYGGYLMLMAMAKAPKRWACGVCLYGFTDLEVFYRNIPGWMQQWVETQIGTPEENPEFYRDRSPITWCSEITAPLLFLQGENDPRIPLVLSKLLMSKLEKHKKNCRLKVYKDEGHGFQKKENQIDANREIVSFLSAYLPKG